MLATACTAAAAWPAEGDGTPTLAVNISAGQLQDHHFAADVRTALRRSGLSGHRLILEVTESMLITDHPHVLDVLDDLKQLGVHIAVDDFGVGYSSLKQLRGLPIDSVKIDRSFVEQIDCGDQTSRPVINALLQLARDLNLTTVAEGIESDGQRAWLNANGCDTGQGYLLSRPLEAAAAAKLARGSGRLAASASGG